MEWKALVDELRTTWKTLWREKIEDRIRAEGIAGKDYSSLFVNRGTVIIATRNFKPLDFVEILERHKPSEMPNAIPPSPSRGGWGKFARDILSKQKRSTTRKRDAPLEKGRFKNQQKKKGGRGWLHR